MDFNIEHLQAQKCLFKRRTGAYGKENASVMQSMKIWAAEKGLLEGSVFYGIAWDDENTPVEKRRYDVCLVTENLPASTEKDICHGEIPAGRYLIFTIEHTQDAVQSFWNSIVKIISETGEIFDTSKPILERYQQELLQQHKCEFCVPII